MAAKRKLVVKGGRTLKSRSSFPTPLNEMTAISPQLLPSNLGKIFTPRFGFVLALFIILAALLWANKSWLVVATVDNRPIFRWDFEGRLVGRFGSQVLDDIVTEQIIKNAATKQGISVTNQEVDAKVSDINKSLQGKITLKELLAQQGMTEADLRRQLLLQIMLEKMTASSVVVTDSEVQTYIDKNKDNLPATDAASLKTQVRQALTSQKRNQAFQDLFTSLKGKAKVVKFL